MIKKTKKKLRVSRAQAHRTLLNDVRTLEVAHAAAGISESVNAGPDHLLAQLREKMSGFPGVWLLCARASAALEDEISNLPMLDDYYDEMIGNLAAALIGDPREWTNEAIKEKLSEIIDDVVVEIAQRPNLLAAAKGDLDRMLDDLE